MCCCEHRFITCLYEQQVSCWIWITISKSAGCSRRRCNSFKDGMTWMMSNICVCLRQCTSHRLVTLTSWLLEVRSHLDQTQVALLYKSVWSLFRLCVNPILKPFGLCWLHLDISRKAHFLIDLPVKFYVNTPLAMFPQCLCSVNLVLSIKVAFV